MKLPIYDYFPVLINKCDSEGRPFVLQQFEMTSVRLLHWNKITNDYKEMAFK